MNGFVPALVAVMLAELGPRALLYADARRQETVLWLIAALVFAAAASGYFAAKELNEWADAMMIALALAFAAVGQVQQVRPSKGIVATVAAFWRGGALILIFALATRFGPVSSSLGGLCGLAGAAIATRALMSGGIPMAPVRWGAAGILILTSAFLAVGALRLV